MRAHNLFFVLMLLPVLSFSAGGFFFEDGSFTGGNRPVALAVADFNHDNHADVAIANYSAPTITLWFGTGDGGFTAGSDLPVDTMALDILAADFNGDTYDDIVVANAPRDHYSLLINQGNGTFADAVVSEDMGYGVYTIGACDVDNDLDNDLIVSRAGGVVRIMKNDGAGNFQFFDSLHVAFLNWTIALAKLNDDDYFDLVVARGYSTQSGSLHIRYGNGDGTFELVADIYYAGSGPIGLNAADYDGDDDIDLAFANNYSGKISVMFNDGFGVFTDPVDYNWEAGLSSLVAVDVDDDNDLDLAATRFGPLNSGSMMVMFNDGAGDFSEKYFYASDAALFDIGAADFDEDNDPDLVVLKRFENEISIYSNFSYLCGDANTDKSLNVGDVVYMINYIFKDGPPPEPIEAGDANCDGDANVGDAVHTVNTIFNGGEPACCR